MNKKNNKNNAETNSDINTPAEQTAAVADAAVMTMPVEGAEKQEVAPQTELPAPLFKAEETRFVAVKVKEEVGFRFGLWGVWDKVGQHYVGTGEKKACRDAERALSQLTLV